MENNTNIKSENTGDYQSKMLTFFIILSVIQALVIIFLIFRSDKSEDADPEVLNPDTLSLQASPTPGNSLKPVATRPLPTPTPKPVAKTQKFPLDKTYTFPVTDPQGNKLADIQYKIIDYELTNQVTVNNFYKAIVTDDKEILVFNVELTNDEDRAVNIMAGDYLRLTKNGEDKLIAPDIDSDPVEVRPQSTKNTKLGFTLLKTDKGISVEVGELGGDKETIEIR
ncbi:hypothetical protein JXA63_04695 [Candidatus Woesebacteria bacterium]|nr:hypothetical protein [Candidatus Woesebacteria bacterium]